MALERPAHQGAVDDYERRQVRLYDALSTLQPGDTVRFATVRKTWSEVLDVTVTGSRAEARIAAPRRSRSTCPHGPYKYVVSRAGDGLEWDYKGAVAD